MACAYAGLDRDNEAVEAFQEALRMRPDSFYSVANLGVGYLKLGRVPEAIAAFTRALDLDGGEPGILAGVHLKLGEAYIKLGHLMEAREQLRVLEEADPDAAKELRSILAAASSH